MSSLPASTSQSRPVNGRFSSVHKWPVLGVARGPLDCTCERDTHDICGPLAGLSIRASDPTRLWALRTLFVPDARRIIVAGGGVVLLGLERDGQEIYLLFTSTLADPAQRVTSNLDVRDRLFSVAAPLMALKRLAGGQGWTRDNRFANVVIDDAPLKSKYGFIDFRRLTQRVAELRLCFTLAFIPWNYRRGGGTAVQLIRQNSDRFSLCIHGCDHTRGEFGTDDRIRLNGLASLGSARMDALAHRTGIPYQRIMVFPQGVLSARAMQVLKQNEYLAAVNTEVLDVTGQQSLSLRELLQPSVTSYHGFPLFLRRKVADGIENIAFDLWLGKPAILVTHHEDYYSDDAAVWRLTEELACPVPE